MKIEVLKILLLNSLFILTAVAKTQALPLGGEIKLEKNWDFLENNLSGVKTHLIFNKTNKNLFGAVLNGNIETESACNSNTKKTWRVCPKILSIDDNEHYQITIERTLGKVYQKYLVVFSYSKKLGSKNRKEIESLIKELEQQ